MNHSVYTIRDYVCGFYSIPVERINQPIQNARIVKARRMMLLLAGHGKDKYVAGITGRSRCWQTQSRKTILGYMEYDRDLKKEFELLRDGLMKYEIYGCIPKKINSIINCEVTVGRLEYQIK